MVVMIVGHKITGATELWHMEPGSCNLSTAYEPIHLLLRSMQP